MSPELFLGLEASLTTSRSSLTEELRTEEEFKGRMARILDVDRLLLADEETPPAPPPSVSEEEFTRLGEEKLPLAAPSTGQAEREAEAMF